MTAFPTMQAVASFLLDPLFFYMSILKAARCKPVTKTVCIKFKVFKLRHKQHLGHHFICEGSWKRQK